MVVSGYGNDDGDDGDGDVDGVNDCDEMVGHRFDPELDRIDMSLSACLGRNDGIQAATARQ